MNALLAGTCFLGTIQVIFSLATPSAQIAASQFDPSRKDLQLAYNMPFQAPQAGVAERRLNAHDFLLPEPVLLLACAPALTAESASANSFHPSAALAALSASMTERSGRRTT